MQRVARPVFAGYAAIIAAALLLTFHDGLAHMARAWQQAEYSHGYVIPIVAAALFLSRLDKLPRPLAGSWAGPALLAVALLLLAAGRLSATYAISQYAFLLALLGLCLAWLGRRGTVAMAAPLLYLAFMVPLPQFVYTTLSAKMQLLSSSLGVAIIRAFDVSVFLEGNVIDLGVYKLQVVDACSGLRYLFPLSSFGFLAASLYRGRYWEKALLFVSTLPITLVMNSIRIAIAGLLVDRWGIAQAEGFLHYFEGWAIFLACLAVLYAEMALLRRLSGGKGAMVTPLNWGHLAGVLGNLPARMRRAPAPPRQVLAATGLLAVAALAGLAISERPEQPLARASLSEFPLTVEGWRGRTDSLDREVLDALRLSDYMLVDYRHPAEPAPVNLHVAFYDSQRQGASVHSPQACIPGGGWQITDFSRRSVEAGQGRMLQVNRAVIKKGGMRQVVYYWFRQRGRDVTNEYAVKWFILWDALTRNRTDGALVRIAAAVPEGEDIAEADRRLSGFLRGIYPTLPAYIPD